jgi:Xaa-Pro dipeptidase
MAQVQIPNVDIPKEAYFSQDEYQRRLRLVREKMAERGLDVLLVFGAANVYYLTGYSSVNSWDFQCCVLGLTGAPSLIIFDFELGRFAASSWLPEDKVVAYTAHDEPIGVIRSTLSDLGLLGKTIAIEETSPNLGVAKYRRLLEMLAGENLVDAGGLVEMVRLVKSAEEIAYLRRAAEVTRQGMDAALDVAQENAFDHEVAAAAYGAMLRAGGDVATMEPIVAVGYRSGLAHSSFAHLAIKRGDSVFVELGGCVHRYTAPLMATKVVGGSNPERAEVLDAARRTVAALAVAARPGVLASDVARAGLAAIQPVLDRIIFHYNFGWRDPGRRLI